VNAHAAAITRRGWLLFAAMCVIWGIPYLLIKVAVRDLSPATLVLCRTGIGALILLPIAASRGTLWPALKRWRGVLLFGLVEMAIPWWLLSNAETKLSSSLTGLLVAAVPLASALIVLLTGGRERLGVSHALGLLLGLAGVSALVGFDLGHVSARPVSEVAVVVVCYALGPLILSRMLSDLPAFGVITISLAATAVAYIPIAAFSLPSTRPSGEVIISVLILSAVCTSLAFLLFFALIDQIGPVRATVITYVNPAVAALLGVTILSESFTFGMAIGFVLILAGSVLATRPSERAPFAIASVERVVTPGPSSTSGPSAAPRA
jgi:drug/metabolite transporter (DMT)-like permease